MTALAERRAEVGRLADVATAALRQARAAADAELTKLAGSEVLGEFSAESAAARRAEIQRDLDRRQAEVERLSRALPEIDSRVAQERRKERDAALRRAERRLTDSIGARASAEKSFARALRQADGAAAELLRHRALVASALGEVRALDPDFGLPFCFRRERLGDARGGG